MANSEYSTDGLSASILEFDREITRNDLQSNGIEVTNIVGNGRYCKSIDFQRIGTKLADVEYDPETSPVAVWRPFDRNAVTVLIPSTGRITIVGNRNQKEIRETIRKYITFEFYAEEVVPYEKFLGKFQISNIAATGSLGRKLKLSSIAIGLGLENRV